MSRPTHRQPTPFFGGAVSEFTRGSGARSFALALRPQALSPKFVCRRFDVFHTVRNGGRSIF